MACGSAAETPTSWTSAERCWDAYCAKAGHADDEVVMTAFRLRSGLTGVACGAVRGIPHAGLMTYADRECRKATPAGVRRS